MRYLGLVSGSGALKCEGLESVRVSYELDVFSEERLGITSSGEVRFAADALKNLFDRQNVQIVTDDGHLLGIRFSGKKFLPMSSSAHVDITGDLPTNFIKRRQ